MMMMIKHYINRSVFFFFLLSFLLFCCNDDVKNTVACYLLYIYIINILIIIINIKFNKRLVCLYKRENIYFIYKMCVCVCVKELIICNFIFY